MDKETIDKEAHEFFYSRVIMSDVAIEEAKQFIRQQIEKAYKNGYNQRLKDEGKTGERWQNLYL